MSSILKALKKLEQEKARRAEVPVDIARDILRPPPRRKKSPWLPAAVLGGVVFAVAGLCGYFFYGGGKAPLLQPASLATEAPQTGSAATETPISSGKLHGSKTSSGTGRLPAAKKEAKTGGASALGDVHEKRTTPSHPSRATAKTARSRAGNPAPKASSPLARKRAVGKNGAKSSAAPRVSAARDDQASLSRAGASAQSPPVHSRREGTAPTSGMKGNQGPAATPSLLVVSGIAYQADESTRLAVVNGLPVMEGSVVEGARVKKIFSDRVRFSRDGKVFDVLLQRPWGVVPPSPSH